MIKKIRLGSLVLLGALVVPSLVAEPITKVAVLDYPMVLRHFAKDSRALRRLEEKRRSYQKEIERLNDEIRSLEERRIQAEEQGKKRKALDIENTIYKKRDYLREFIRTKKTQLAKENRSMRKGEAFVNEILNAIKYVTETRGYALVFKSSDADLLWWSEEVDITDEVIARLARS